MARCSALTRLSSNYQVVVPKPVRDALRLKSGDLFEATATRAGVLLRPKVLSDRPTLEQLKKDIEESKAAVKAGRVLGPFKSAGAAMKAVNAYARRAHRAVRS
jgi:AbrB family looped-hinge helix DNA binding protein